MVTGHAGNENAAKLKRAQKEELEEILSRPPSEAGVKAGFWDVPALKDVVSIKFGVEYRSESSYRLLMRFLGMSFKLPDPFDKRRDEKAITRRMAEIRRQVADLLFSPRLLIQHKLRDGFVLTGHGAQCFVKIGIGRRLG